MANSIVKPSMLAPQHANVGRFLSPSFLCYLFLPQRNFVCEKFTESNLKIETRRECFSRLVTDNKEQTSLPQNVEFIGFTLRFNKAETFFISRSEAKNHASHYFYISIEQGKVKFSFVPEIFLSNRFNRELFRERLDWHENTHTQRLHSPSQMKGAKGKSVRLRKTFSFRNSNSNIQKEIICRSHPSADNLQVPTPLLMYQHDDSYFSNPR